MPDRGASPQAGRPVQRGKQSEASEIATGMVQIMSRYTGRGPTKARATVNTNLVVVLFEDALTKAEQNLVAADQAGAVAMMRRTFKEMLGPESITLVETILQRRVVSFLSDTDPFANVAAQLFVLDHEPETGVVGTFESRPD